MFRGMLNRRATMDCKTRVKTLGVNSVKPQSVVEGSSKPKALRGEDQATVSYDSGLIALATWIAMRLATDVEACCSLLRGEPVDPSRLDEDELEWARAMELVRLDVAAIDLVASSLRRSQLVKVLQETAL